MKGFLKRLTGDSGSRRILMVVGVVLAFIGVGWFFTKPPTPVNVSVVRGVPAQAPTVQGGTKVSDTYRQALNESDNQRVEAARASGESAVPTIVLNPQSAATPPDPDRQQPRLPGNEPPRQEPVVVAKPLTGPQPLPLAPPVVRPVTEQQVQAMARSVGTMGDDKLVGAKVEYFNDGKLSTDTVANADRQLASIVNGNSGSIIDKDKPFPGTVLYAEMVSEANSDSPGPVLARIQQGPLTGATLIGQFKTGTGGDTLVIDFKRMSIVRNEGSRQINKVVDIEAYAVDADKLGTGLATDVDRHLFQKIALTAATTFIQGFGNAVGQSGTTVSSSPTTGTQIAYPTLDTKQQLIVAGGQTAGQVGNIVMREFGNKPTTIKVRAGTPIGILFL